VDDAGILQIIGLAGLPEDISEGILRGDLPPHGLVRGQ